MMPLSYKATDLLGLRVPTEHLVVMRFWRLLTNAAASKIQSSGGSTGQKRQALRSSSWSGSRSLKRHFLSRTIHARFLSREERLYLLAIPLFIYLYPFHSRTCICVCVCVFFSYCLSNYKLYWQLTTSSRLIRAFHGEENDDVSVADADSRRCSCMKKLIRGVLRRGLFWRYMIFFTASLPLW